MGRIFFKELIEMGRSAVIYIKSFIKSGSKIKKLLGEGRYIDT
jgi:hypothetical protein